jgi:hypothetical protein
MGLNKSWAKEMAFKINHLCGFWWCGIHGENRCDPTVFDV